MTLEVLSSIHGAEASEAVEQLFEVIKNAKTDLNQITDATKSVNVNELRADKAIPSSDIERNLIRNNFPRTKDGFLVVAKVIEE